MRSLTPAEEDALVLAIENEEHDAACGPHCKTGGPADFSISDAVFIALHGRQLVRVIPCEVGPGRFHCHVTDAGRYVLSLARLLRTA
jgi:hypothetical protein